MPSKVLLLQFPVVLAVLIFGEGVTQDGPAHLASGKISIELIKRLPNVDSAYALQVQPLPNWSGHLICMVLARFCSLIWANRLLNLSSLVLPGLCLAWLYQVVRSENSEPKWGIAFGLSILSMNVVWTFGFTSFLIGLAFAWVLLAMIWKRLAGFSGGVFLLIALGWCLLFVSHLVAFAIAGLVFGVLLLFTPEIHLKHRFRMAFTTIPSLSLLGYYRSLTAGRPMELIWEHWQWSHWYSPSNWVRQLGWVDPISLASRNSIPFWGSGYRSGVLFQPVIWLSLVLGLMLVFHFVRLRELFASRLRGWMMAALFLGLIGVFGPDTLGKEQGHYLQQRLLIAAFSLLFLTCLENSGRLVPFFIAVSWFLQMLFAVDYLRQSQTLISPVLSCLHQVEPEDRLIVLTDAVPWQFRANPRLHRDSLLVWGNSDVVSWNLYEASHTYFPLVFREKQNREIATDLERVSIELAADQIEARTTLIESLLSRSDPGRSRLIILCDNHSDLRRIIQNFMIKGPLEKWPKGRLLFVPVP